MFKALSLASIVLFSSIAVAGFGGNTTVRSTNVIGEMTDSREAAVQQAHQMEQNLTSRPASSYKSKIENYTGDLVDSSSIKIIDTEFYVKEVKMSDGTVAFQPVLSVDYKYRTFSGGGGRD